MWRFALGTAAAAMAVADLALMPERPPDPPAAACPPEQLLVKVSSAADPDAVSRRHGATLVSEVAGPDVYLMTVPAGTAAEKITALEADPEVVYAEPNATTRAPAVPAAGVVACEP